MGYRTRASAEKLWNSLPECYRNHAIYYTDFWRAYTKVISEKQHQAVGKETGETSPIEQLNNTLRQRISRLVRQSLSFSKNLFNHRIAIWDFIHHDNAELEAT